MAFYQGSRSQLLMVAETTQGVTPATPTMKTVNFSTYDLGPTVAYVENTTMRSDRNRQAPQPGNRGATGQIEGELHYGGHDDLVEGLLGGAWTSNAVTNGTAKKTYTFQRGQLTDVPANNVYGTATGVYVNEATFTFGQGQNVKATYGLIGKSFAWNTPASTSIAAAVTPAVSATSLMKSSTGSVTIDGQSVATMTTGSVTVSNGASLNYVYGADFAPDFDQADLSVTGSCTFYWSNLDLLQKFVNGAPASVVITASDGSNSLVYSLPHTTFTGGSAPVNAKGSLTIEMPFEATLSAAQGYSIRINRVAGA